MKEATVDITVMLITENMTRAAVFLMIEEVAHLTEEYVNFPRVLIVLSFMFEIHVTAVCVQALEVGRTPATCAPLLLGLVLFAASPYSPLQ